MRVVPLYDTMGVVPQTVVHCVSVALSLCVCVCVCVCVFVSPLEGRDSFCENV